MNPDAQKGILSVAIDGSPRNLKVILDQLEDAAVEVDSLSLRNPTLDDVFLTLIGQSSSLKGDDGEK